MANEDTLRRLLSRQRGWTDSFGGQVTNGTRNQVDISSAYEFNPERLRYFKNGTRVRDAADATFTDREGDYLLEPAAGDVCRVQTAERPRYVVGFDGIASWEAQVTSTLGAGDTVTMGLDDDSTPRNAAFIEINGDSPNRLVIVKAGSEIAAQEFEYPSGIDETKPIRYAITYNWYGVGTFRFSVTSTDATRKDGFKTQNRSLGEVSVDDEKSTNDSNFHIFHEIDAATSGQSLIVGSYGYTVLGDVSATERTKVARLTGLTHSGTAAEYEPVAAFRIDAARGNVFTQLDGLECTPTDTEGEILATVVPADETDASGFATPPQHSPNNSVIEQTTSVTTFPDQSGAIVTSAADPNGYQVGFYASTLTGQGATQARSATAGRQIRPVYEDDVVVLLYKPDTATAETDLSLVYSTKQLW